MRLSKLKLAGFKSFVDPTTLIIPGNLVGVVGPNGCGKSNIIDAVTWVMGESSAKHLRGDALTDVIFNGSSSRQAVGQASVELIFDNSAGKLGGQYASYSEISLKRQINREAISTYTLNGTRCRRKDIQTLFLGTGLGPRGYGIIEQGMISRLIEAKPADLRLFIEEAAGISRFRERRRETETRMRHTHENIERLNDIRDELDKQLEQLQRQARAAERYQLLKGEARQLKAELIALNWRSLKVQAGERSAEVRQQEGRLEQAMATLRQVEAEIERQREVLTGANTAFNQAQSAFYQIGAEISQLEQKIQHDQARAQSWQAELEDLRQTLAALKTEQQQDQAQLSALTAQLGSLQPELEDSRSASEQARETLSQAEQAVQGWHSDWDAFNAANSDFVRQMEVDATLLSHLESGIEEIRQRQALLQSQLEARDTAALEQDAERLKVELQACNEALSAQRARQQHDQQEVSQHRDAVHALSEALAIKRAAQHKLEGKTASLEALQAEDAGGEQEALTRWLAAHALQAAPRLVQALEVEAEWMLALETVLGNFLHDVCLEDIDFASLKVQELGSGRIGFLAADTSDTSDTSPPEPGRPHYPRLSDKLSSDFQINSLLAGIYVADDIEQARAMLADLAEGESVVTRDGIWLGRRWLRVNKTQEGGCGLLSREHQLSALRTQDAALQAEIQALHQRLDDSRRLLDEAEQGAREQQEELNGQQEQAKALHAQYAEARTRSQQARERVEQIELELEALDSQCLIDQGEAETLRARAARTEDERARLDEQREQLSARRERHRLALDSARGQWQASHEASHAIALQLESLNSQRASLEQAIKRSDTQVGNYAARSAELKRNLGTTTAPIASLQQDLEARLARQVEAERKLASARNQVQAGDANLREQERRRSAAEDAVQTLRGELERARMLAQEMQVRLQTLLEQLQESDQEAETLLSALAEDATVAKWQSRLTGVEAKIQRLGAINLAAIEQFEQLKKRKHYLDSQHEDLSAALTILEAAIHKIDKETRTRFKETFDKLNNNLKQTFPVLFGGGHAYMEMTDADLLETGVTVMARPPGKRNSTIHLLSGGEKALTAVALVFSIFKLNPAPFCILDEVDAPLDDTNAARFGQLVQEMSTDVQFLFITHNKITMEIAHQLLGVTMHEAGVSRIVSVDMDEAVVLAESA